MGVVTDPGSVGFLIVANPESIDRSKGVKSELMARFEAHEAYDVEGSDFVGGLCGLSSLQACVEWASSAA